MFVCKAEGCENKKHKAKGYCEFHYNRLIKGVGLSKPKRQKNFGKICNVDDCEKPAKYLGMCEMHYQRHKKYGDPNYAGKGRPYGSGKEWHKTAHGYIVRYEPENPNAGPNGQVYQHRHIMSEVLGRPLHSYENVHHINGDRSDNRIENLELWRKGQPAGQRVTDKVAWCAEFLTDDVIKSALKLKPELLVDVDALSRRLRDAMK